MMIAAGTLVVLLVALTVIARIGPAGWLAGIAFGVVGWAVLTDALRRADVSTFGPAERFTLARAVVVGGVTALVAEVTDPRPDPVAPLVVLAVLALLLSAVGRRPASPFDVEVDAFLVLVLSAMVATSLGVWVVAIGALRYVFAGAVFVGRRLAPWLGAPLPQSPIRTAVAAAQVAVLTTVASGLLPHPAAVVLTALALVALAGSFAGDIRWLSRHRATLTTDHTETLTATLDKPLVSAPSEIPAATPLPAPAATYVTRPIASTAPRPATTVSSETPAGVSATTPSGTPAPTPTGVPATTSSGTPAPTSLGAPTATSSGLLPSTSVGGPFRATSRVRRVMAPVWTVLAGALVLFALVGPNRLGQLAVGAFVRIPVEGFVGGALLLVLPRRSRRVVVVVAGGGLGLLTIVKLIDMGFYEVFDRPFHLVFDWSFFGPALDFLVTSVGGTGAVFAVAGVVLLVVGVLVLMTFAVGRLTRVAVGNRTSATHTVAVLGVVWVVCAVVGVRVAPDEPLAARSAADHVYDNVRQMREGLLDGERFAARAAVDDYRYTPGSELLTGLRGKDVLLVYVESYGRVAIEDSDSAPVIDPILDAGTTRLRAAGFESRSAFLTSPTHGGGSAMAHATLQTGLWIDNMQRYLKVVTLDRMTLSVAFNRAGWRTVGDVPANTEDWPDGDLYHFDQVYDSRNIGYQGPRFSYATVPDQYTLQHFENTERTAGAPPVMAEIDLISSHTPFTPIPDLVDWNDIGDGSIYDPMPAKGPQPGDVWPDPHKVRAAYTAAIAYSLKSLLSYVETYGDDDLVVVFLGDHQPQTIVSGQEGSRDVPITIVAKDPAVLAPTDTWGWQDGLNPAPDSPAWPMDTFRDRFLATYGPQKAPTHDASPHR
jgi:hypothetical protein